MPLFATRNVQTQYQAQGFKSLDEDEALHRREAIRRAVMAYRGLNRDKDEERPQEDGKGAKEEETPHGAHHLSSLAAADEMLFRLADAVSGRIFSSLTEYQDYSATELIVDAEGQGHREDLPVPPTPVSISPTADNHASVPQDTSSFILSDAYDPFEM
jgi:hypothetical protein